MPGQIYTINSIYRPTDGSGSISITFHDLRKSSDKRASELLKQQVARIMENRPANAAINFRLIEGERFSPTWHYDLSTTFIPAAPIHPDASPKG